MGSHSVWFRATESAAKCHLTQADHECDFARPEPPSLYLTVITQA